MQPGAARQLSLLHHRARIIVDRRQLLEEDVQGSEIDIGHALVPAQGMWVPLTVGRPLRKRLTNCFSSTSYIHPFLGSDVMLLDTSTVPGESFASMATPPPYGLSIDRIFESVGNFWRSGPVLPA